MDQTPSSVDTTNVSADNSVNDTDSKNQRPDDNDQNDPNPQLLSPDGHLKREKSGHKHRSHRHTKSDAGDLAQFAQSQPTPTITTSPPVSASPPSSSPIISISSPTSTSKISPRLLDPSSAASGMLHPVSSAGSSEPAGTVKRSSSSTSIVSVGSDDSGSGTPSSSNTPRGSLSLSTAPSMDFVNFSDDSDDDASLANEDDQEETKSTGSELVAEEESTKKIFVAW